MLTLEKLVTTTDDMVQNERTGQFFDEIFTRWPHLHIALLYGY